jgi:5'(3')-deoxyribonucleotidase
MGKTFIIDMDSTITQCSELWIEYLNRVHKMNIKKEDITDWNALGKILANKYNISQENGDYLAEIPLYKKGFFANQLPYPDSIDVINKMINEFDDKIIIATKPPASSLYAYSEKFYWIKKYFTDNFGKIMFVATPDKFVVEPGAYLIDDGAHNLKRSVGIHSIIKYNQPWNMDYIDFTYSVNDWKEMLELRKKLG